MTVPGSTVHDEVTLPRRARPQPEPAIVPGGDCGACVIGGLLQLEVREAYKLSGDRPESLDRFSLCKLVQKLQWEGVLRRAIVQCPLFPEEPHRYNTGYGIPAWEQALPWFDYVRMAVEAGYYGICNVNFARQGPWADSDHVVLVCGTRELWTPNTAGGERIDNQLLISCSAATTPEEEWVDVANFLQFWGGFNIVLVKPAA